MKSTYYREKVVFITGASSGIGEALARELANQGALLALAARRRDRLESIVREISRPEGSHAAAFDCDVTLETGPQNAILEAIERFHRLDILIANAGFGVVGHFENLKIEDYQRQFETNIYGVLRTIYAALPELKKTRGQIVLLGSVSSYVSLPRSSPYSMSKFAIRALAYALSEEMRPHGISVTLLSPGFVQSEIRRVNNHGQLQTGTQDPLPSWLPMPTAQAARRMARAIASHRREEVITTHGKIIIWIERFFPSLIRIATQLGLRGRPEPQGGHP